MITATELRDQLLTKAEEDSGFRALLISDPKATIASEIGAGIPEGFDITVHEDSFTAIHLVLPPSPELTDADLELVAGAASLWEQKISKYP